MSRLFIDDGFPAEGGDKVMLATPVYQDPDASYTFAMSKSREALHKAGIRSAFVLFSGNCHVDDSRNKIVSEFLNSDCTSLVFIDADVATCEARDPKGLYRRARAGDIKEFTGVSAPYEEPTNPDISVDTSGRGIEECLDELVEYVTENFRKSV